MPLPRAGDILQCEHSDAALLNRKEAEAMIVNAATRVWIRGTRQILAHCKWPLGKRSDQAFRVKGRTGNWSEAAELKRGGI